MQSKTVSRSRCGRQRAGAYSAGAYEALHERVSAEHVGASIGGSRRPIAATGGGPHRRLREFGAQAGSAARWGFQRRAGCAILQLCAARNQSAVGARSLYSHGSPVSLERPACRTTWYLRQQAFVATLELVSIRGCYSGGAARDRGGRHASGEPVFFDTRKVAFDRGFLATTAFTPDFPGGNIRPLSRDHG